MDGLPLLWDQLQRDTITDQREAAGVRAALYQWNPSIAPASIVFVTSNKYEELKNSCYSAL